MMSLLTYNNITTHYCTHCKVGPYSYKQYINELHQFVLIVNH